jgi:hypothetical protein
MGPVVLAGASMIRPLAALARLVKPTQILFGTDYPFAAARGVAAGLRTVGLFNDTDLQASERGNAARIMPRYHG